MTNETMTNDRNANMGAIALAFTAREETSALHSTVAWAALIVADVCGWNGTPNKGGRKVAIKKAREQYGYIHDTMGQPVLDAKGNRVKRSAVFSRLALVDSLFAFMLANEKEWIETIHNAATDPASDPEHRDSDVSDQIEQLAARLADLAKGKTIDALKHYLATGVAKVDSVTDAADALADKGETGETDKGETGETGETDKGETDKGETGETGKGETVPTVPTPVPVTFEQVMTTLVSMRHNLTPTQIESLESFVESCRAESTQAESAPIADAA